MEKDFAWGNEHTVQCADDDLIELYTGNLYGFTDQCQLNKFN